MKLIDADKLKAIIKAQIKERNEWMKDIDRSDRQDQLWSDLNEEDMSILQIITSLQPEVDLEKELDQWRHKHFNGKRDGDYSGEYLERESQLDLALHFYELGLNARKKK